MKEKNKEKEELPYSLTVKRIALFIILNFINLFLLLSYINKFGPVGENFNAIFIKLFGNFYIAPLIIIIFFYSVVIFSQGGKIARFWRLILSLVLFLSYVNLLDIFSYGLNEGLISKIINKNFIRIFDYSGAITINVLLFVLSIILVFGPQLLSLYENFRLKKEEKKLLYDDEDSKTKSIFERLSNKKSASKVVVEEIKKIEEIEPTKDRDTKEISRKFLMLEKLEEEKWKGIEIKEEELSTHMKTIRRTLLNFGIQVQMDEIHLGPRVTQYTLKPKEGTKLSQIVSLTSELALSLARHPIRIEAPIPGKSLVGVEVPNEKTFIVKLKNLLETGDYKKIKIKNLAVALGRDLSGKPVYVNLESMPHLLIAGSTGSGKSICVHNILINLLYNNSPDELKLILIDPKKVELSVYDGLPYVLEVVKDTEKVINILKWLVNEMEKRYDELLAKGERDIMSYNNLIRKNDGQTMPYIVLVIDELADIMLRFGKDFEALVIRLAQMSRAVGIHLILSTQRPSADVITGLIKANITYRIGLKTSSLIDSRVILDRSGAERLLGRGDMLFLDGSTSYLKRIQGVFLSVNEVKNLVNALKKFKSDFELSKKFKREVDSIGENENEDELCEEARRIVEDRGFATTSLLQRKLKVGYMRAARLIDLLEEKGIIESQDGNKPRKVIKNG